MTYTNSEGQTRPDAGARILVLPLQHPNVSRIAAGSFQSGATSQDLKLAQAVIRTLGGDFALVDATGKYTIQVANSGQYQLVILSRYQPRSEKQSTEEVAGFLHVWFDQPQVLLGQTQFFRAEMGLDVQKSQSRDHSFPIAE